jgi:hypothetical protein
MAAALGDLLERSIAVLGGVEENARVPWSPFVCSPRTPPVALT